MPYRNVDIEVPYTLSRTEGGVFLFEFDCKIACTVEGRPDELYVSNIGGVMVEHKDGSAINLLDATDSAVKSMAMAEVARLLKDRDFDETAVDHVLHPRTRRFGLAATGCWR